MRDRFDREIDYLRLSVTDRCNLRCRYCMPETGIAPLSRSEILTFEEIEAVCRTAAKSGIRKVKVTGGEPLVRREVPALIGRISAVPGIEEVTLTTNGILLEEQLPALLENHLSAVNVSLDTLSRERYALLTGRDVLENVLAGLRASVDAGLRTKVNAVLAEGLWADTDGQERAQEEDAYAEAMALLALAQTLPVDVRFIEMMPIGQGSTYAPLRGRALLERLRVRYPGLTRDAERRGNGPAVYYRIPGFFGAVGFISAVHEGFCATCNRLRLTATGQLKPCLCYGESFDLRAILRDESLTAGECERRLALAIQQAVGNKPKAHCFGSPDGISEERTMEKIGG